MATELCLWPLALNECPWNGSSATDLSRAPCWLVLCALWTENENANAWFMCQASTATLPGWAAQCTCGTETASLQGTVLLTLTPLLYWDGSSCSSWKGKQAVCCFCDAWEEEEKLPVLNCWPTTRVQHYWSWVSLSWMYLLNWESREVTETVSQGNFIAMISSIIWIWQFGSSYFLLEAYIMFVCFPSGFC